MTKPEKRHAGKPVADRAPIEFAPTPEPLAPTEAFLTAAAELDIAFDEGDLHKLGRFLAMLTDANRVVNLTAITSPEEAWQRHALDALTLLPILAELPVGSRVIDVGSGGGVPGIPLAIAMAHVEFTLLEPTGKKAAFLEHAASELGLRNVEVVRRRAEQAGAHGATGSLRAAFDAAIVRAVGRLAIVAELTVPLVKRWGVVVAVKGERAGEELEEAAEALKLLKAHHETTIPTPTGQLVILRKDADTPVDYPRRDGEPKRAPLGVARTERGR